MRYRTNDAVVLATTKRCWPRAHGCSARRAIQPSAPAKSPRGAGIAGPGLYRSFSSKQAILDALVRRLDDWWSLEYITVCCTPIWKRRSACMDSSNGLSGSAWTPRTSFRFRSPNCPTPLPKSATGTRNRGGPRGGMDRPHPSAVPRTTAAEARLLVAAATSFIEDVTRTWHLTQYGGVADEMAAIALSILTSRS